MTAAQAQNLASTLLGQGATIRVFQNVSGEWVIHAVKPGVKITSGQMTGLANGVAPASPAVSAQTDHAEFV